MGNGESSTVVSPRHNGHSPSQNGHSQAYISSKRTPFATVGSDYVDISAMEALSKEEMEERFLEIVVSFVVFHYSHTPKNIFITAPVNSSSFSKEKDYYNYLVK